MPHVGHLFAGERPRYDEVLNMLAKQGRVDAVVFVHARDVGAEQLAAYGQVSNVVTAKLRVKAIGGCRRPLGSDWSDAVHFSSLNAADQTDETVKPWLQEIARRCRRIVRIAIAVTKQKRCAPNPLRKRRGFFLSPKTFAIRLSQRFGHAHIVCLPAVCGTTPRPARAAPAGVHEIELGRRTTSGTGSDGGQRTNCCPPYGRVTDHQIAATERASLATMLGKKYRRGR